VRNASHGAARVLVALLGGLLGAPLLGCQGDDSTSASAGDTTDPPVAALDLPDVNPSSPTYGSMVSPRDFLEQVSGWFFLHST
jgi:hypothetical protein